MMREIISGIVGACVVLFAQGAVTEIRALPGGFYEHTWTSPNTGSTRPNNGWDMGYNHAGSGVYVDPAEPMFYEQIESYFHPADNAPVMEWHWNYYPAVGSEFPAVRPLEFDVYRDTGRVNWIAQGDVYSLHNSRARLALSLQAGASSADTHMQVFGLGDFRRDGLALVVRSADGAQTPLQVAANPGSVSINGQLWYNGQPVTVGPGGCLVVQ